VERPPSFLEVVATSLAAAIPSPHAWLPTIEGQNCFEQEGSASTHAGAFLPQNERWS
jgi:hypothetical protein